MERRYPCAYILASPTGTLYTGVTSDIMLRMQQHKAGKIAGFAAKYGCTRLVWMEDHPDMPSAIACEKQIKRWSRAKKVALIIKENPGWRDIAEDWEL